MNETILNNIIEKVRKDLCVADGVYLGFERKYIASAKQEIVLENDSVFLLVNELLDVNPADKIILSSENNFLIFSKSTFESLKTYEKFRRYITVRTQSQAFVPYYLDFIKVKPYITPK
jgi:hypothetical protein